MKKVILIILLTIFLTGCGHEEKISHQLNQDIIVDNNSNIENNQNNNKDNTSNNNIFDTDNNVIENNNISNNNPETTKDEKNNNNNNSNNSTTISYSNNDKIVISKIETINKEVDTLVNESPSENNKSKAKGIFIMLVDFVFYDGEIKGVTFDSLTEAGKTKVLQLINTIDEKIEKHFPNYKENISDKTSKAFLKASELIKKGASNIKDFAKEKLGEKYYQDIIDSKDEFILYTKNALSIVSEFSSSLFNNIKDKLSEWYEEFKNKN